MIRFRENINLTVITEYDEEKDNIVEDSEVLFKAGERVDGDIYFDDGSDWVDLQFGDGSVANSVERNSFEIIS